MEITFYLSSLVILVITYLSTICLWRKFQNYPPSPFLCFPVIGHMYVVKHPLSESLANLANRFGPIITVWFGSQATLLISSASAAEECLNTNDIVFCNRSRGTFVGKYRGYDYTSINLAPYGPHWRNLRKICAVEVLSSLRLQSLVSVRADEVKFFIDRLCKSSSEVVEMRPEIFDTILNIMTRMIFGERYFGVEAKTEKAKRLRDIVMESIVLSVIPCVGDDIPYLRWLDWKQERRFNEYKEKRDVLMAELMEDYRTKRKEMKKIINQEDVMVNKPMIYSLLELQESNPEYYHDHLLHSLILELLVGSSDSTTNIVEWALALLLNNPQVLKKLRAEIDNHVGYARLLEESDLNNLPYLRCVLNETLRMYPPFPLLIPHQSSKDCIVGGYHIPRGIILLVNIYAIQNDPKVWDNPRSFRPERFEGVEGHRVGYKLMPFGSGRRSCPGEGLGIRVTGLILGTLIQCLDLERVDDNKFVDMAQLEGPNIQMAMPLNARIQSRQFMLNLLHELSDGK